MTPPLCHRLEACRQELVPCEAGAKVWRRARVGSFEDLTSIVQAISQAMAAAGLSKGEIYRVHLGLQEAIINANKHGHQGDWGKPVEVRYHVSGAGVVAEIEDRGPGFDPSQVPDPLAPENIDRPSGRGLLLMRTYLSGVCHNEQGNCICLCKHRCETPQPQVISDNSNSPGAARQR
jgi:serine/threonine-protein kinase RsbW